jgi:hypothetical protein
LKKYYILLFLVSIWSLSFGQKKEVYLNDDLNEISKEKFDSISEKVSINLRYELDTLIVNVKVLHEKKGTLSKDELTNIKTTLSTISKRELPNNTTLVIDYYSGRDVCNVSSVNYFSTRIYSYYLRDLKKMDHINQFYVYKADKGLKQFGNKAKWHPDTNQLIETLFFPVDYYCQGYVIIDYEGNFFARRGEYNPQEVIDLLQKNYN